MMDLPYVPVVEHVLVIPTLASIIQIPPENKAQTYQDLVCTEEHEAKVRELITAMGEKGYLSLLSDQKHLQLVGNQINHLHPLCFLSVVFLDPYLIQCMKIVMDDGFKRSGLLEGHNGSNGLAHSLTREADKGKLNQYLADFAQEVAIPHDALNPFFQMRDWEGLVRFMIWTKTVQVSVMQPGVQQ